MFGKCFLFCVFPSIIMAVIVNDAGSPKVQLSHGGIVVGNYMTSVNGKQISSFRGIPYAEPPIGPLRFERSKPHQGWTREKLSTHDPEICSQMNPYERNFEVVGSEDCLYLNVYVPAIPSTQKLFSVMVYIHGGGWLTGSASSKSHGPERLLDHDIILVIGNYRLGALGFLSTGTADCPGNNGFKDQLLILNWVRENIGAFGGNSNDVTLFGESAGAVSVGFHIFSNLSKGLFHKAILQSGNIFNNWALGKPVTSRSHAEKLGRLMNCTDTGTNWKELIKCLRTKSVKDIVASLTEYFEFDIDPLIVFPGVVEPDGEGAFLTKQPKDIAIPPSISIPIIIGGTTDEGVIKSGPLLNLHPKEFRQNFSSILPIMLGYQSFPAEKWADLWKRIDAFYFKGKYDWSKSNHQNLTNLFSDQRFNFAMDQFLRHRFIAAKNISIGPTYVYLFDHRGPKSASTFLKSGPEYYGVCHTDDLPYIFYSDWSNIPGDENDGKIKQAMPELWTNFAKMGNPTPEGCQITKWLPADGFPLQYAHLGSKNPENWSLLRNEKGLITDRMQFWRNLEIES